MTVPSTGPPPADRPWRPSLLQPGPPPDYRPGPPPGYPADYSAGYPAEYASGYPADAPRPETRPQTRAETRAETQPRPPARTGPLARWPEALVAVAGLLVWGWQVGTPSPWRDEAATIIVSRRSISGIVAVVRHVDLVHSAFYLLAHLVIQAVGSGSDRTGDQVTAVRLISVLAMTGTAVTLVALGRRLGSVPIGLTAAAALLASPLATRWGQDARPFALVTLIAAIATRVLIGAADRPDRRRLWVGYALCVSLLGLVNVMALLLVTAHAGYLLLTHRAVLWRWWLPAAVGAGVLIGPFALLTFTQRGQVAWLQPPHLYDFTAYYIQAFGTKLVPPLVAVAALAVLVVSRGLPEGPAGQAFALGATWAVIPPALLWAGSNRLPMWNVHYVLFALPGLTLLVAAEVAVVVGGVRDPHAVRGDEHGGERGPSAVARIRALAPVAVLPALAVLAVPAQAGYRDPATGHGEDVLGVARYVAAHARPGDAVLFVPYDLRDVDTLYPGAFAGVDDVAMATGPVPSGTISGLDRPPARIPAALAGRKQVWLVLGNFGDFTTRLAVDRSKLAVLAAGYREAGRADLSVFTVVRYQAPPG
jgi:mannosyltransferase